LLDERIPQPADRLAAQNAVRGTSVDFAGAIELGDVGGADDAPGG